MSLQRSAERGDAGWFPAAANWKDLAVAVAISALAVGVWVESGTWQEARNLAQDPTVLPRAVSVVLWLSALGIVARNVIAALRANAPADPGEAPATKPSGHTAESEPVSLAGAGAAMAGVVAYVIAAFNLGWLVSSALFLAVTAVLLGRDKLSPPRIAIAVTFAVVVTGVVWFGFVELLNVRLPDTVLP